MRPLEASYERIEKATGRKEPVLMITKIGDEWRVSHHQDHGQAGTLELAAYYLARHVERNLPRRQGGRKFEREYGNAKPSTDSNI